ncbi:MAG TPA: outer membrane lipoprotein LolB [Spongiibacteraceae bacterium]|nr:outer membrane lipoprotein LolB [Spongiibacteraceae bacterium]HCS26686.1 outer membrane lipoprotein LolB [Spongiibacteraceae bacterium]
MPERTPGNLPAAALILVFSLLSACSSTPPQPASTSGWGFNGKVGLWAYGEQESANVEWQDCDSSYLVRLSGPLGVGSALVYGNDSGVSLHRGSDDTLYADSPEALLASMGWYLPVSHLRYWLKGLPSPDSPYQREPQSVDALTSLSQSGWRIAYTYQSGQITRISMQDDNIRLKWIIRNWHESAVCTAP